MAKITANFINSGDVPEGGQATVSFTNVAGGVPPYKYHFDFNNDTAFESIAGTSPTVQIPAVFLAEGPRAVTVRGKITDSGNPQQKYETTTRLNCVNIPPIIDLSQIPSEILVGQTIQINPMIVDSDSDVASGFKFSWNFGDGTTAAIGTVDKSWAAAGTFTIKLTCTDRNNASSVLQKTIVVKKMASPLAVAIAAPSELIAQQSTTIRANVTGGTGAIQYAWTFGDGTTANVQAPSKAWAAPGTYQVRVTVTDQAGGSATATVSILIKPIPITVSWNTLPPEIFIGQSVGLSVTATGGSGAITCTWDFGDGTSAVGQSVTKIWSAPGTYAVKVTCTDQFGGSVTIQTNLAIKALPILISLTGFPPELTTNQILTVTAQVEGSGPFQYLWDFGDGTTANTPEFSKKWDTPGTYTIKVMVTDQWGGSASAQTTILIKIPVLGPIRIVQTPDGWHNVGDDINFRAEFI